MAKLPESTGHQRRVRYARAVVRRLRWAGHKVLANELESSAVLVKQLGRSAEDAGEPVDDALTDRAIADGTLDEVAKTARQTLAARSLTASREAPYTSIFPDGIDYYTAAPLDQQTKRYGELLTRLQSFLAEDDAVRMEATPKIETGIASFKQAVEAIEVARGAESLAGIQLSSAEDALDRQLDKTLGALIQAEGRAKAKRYFPSLGGAAARRKKSSTTAPAAPAPEPAMA